jgi:hypothetical protein
MSDTSGMAAVDQAAATITTTEHRAALGVAREEGRQAGLTEAQTAIATARAEGAAAERARLAGIESAALPGHDALIASCKADPTCTPGDAALRINAAERAKLTAAGASIANVETVTRKIAASPTTQPDGGSADTPQTAEGWKAEYAASADLRRDFESAEAYANWKAGQAAGNVRIFKGSRT